MEAVNRIVNSNTFMNIILVGGFAGLSLRSWKQQKYMESLESEKESLTISNKSMKKTIWDWKQQLYSEAESSPNAIVPLSKLKAIYGEAIPPPLATDSGKLPAVKIVV